MGIPIVQPDLISAEIEDQLRQSKLCSNTQIVGTTDKEEYFNKYASKEKTEENDSKDNNEDCAQTLFKNDPGEQAQYLQMTKSLNELILTNKQSKMQSEANINFSKLSSTYYNNNDLDLFGQNFNKFKHNKTAHNKFGINTANASMPIFNKWSYTSPQDPGFNFKKFANRVEIKKKSTHDKSYLKMSRSMRDFKKKPNHHISEKRLKTAKRKGK